MASKTKSSQRWLSRQHQDPYVERAQREGWRSRAVFKLQQIQAKERILVPGRTCLDLGAAPGSWSQYAARVVGDAGLIVAVDVLQMDAVPGVRFLCGDLAEDATRDAIRMVLGDRQTDLVMSDIAPNTTGNRAVDQARSMEISEQTLEFAVELLRPGGDFLVKLFQGAGFEEYVRAARSQFGQVRMLKPAASRAESREIYLLARKYRMV
jgi:23S rRNA (uridine2552-2'-O)-methyltransferase